MPHESAGLRGAPSSFPEAGIKGAWPGTQSRPHCPGTPGPGAAEAELRAGTCGLLSPAKGVSAHRRICIHPPHRALLYKSLSHLRTGALDTCQALYRGSSTRPGCWGPFLCQAGSRLEERPPLSPGMVQVYACGPRIIITSQVSPFEY